MFVEIINHRDRAYAHIRHKILVGEIPVGERLSPEGLAKEIGVSRTPMREALAQLGAEGLLKQVPQYGTFVKEVSRDELSEIYELREILEGIAAERAATRITAERLCELEQLCDQMHQMCRRLRNGKLTHFPIEQEKRWALIDMRFHAIILAASGSTWLQKIATDIKLLNNVVGRQWVSRDRYRVRGHYLTWAAHLRITRSLKRRSGSAARQHMSEHIRGARRTMLEHYWPREVVDRAYDRNAFTLQVVEDGEESSEMKHY
ncbi:MAG: GntR family transcriptional regulator [Phycisphaerales bacterium]|nr:GntR family transcriptional regulator [Phycisphaerales bacterium]